MIIVSVISLAPIYEIFVLLDKLSWERATRQKSQMVHKVKMKCALRLIEVVQYFKEKRNHVGLNQLHIIITEKLVTLLLLSTTSVALWYQMSCWKCERPNWTIQLKDHVFDEKRFYDWIILCTEIVTGVFSHNWTGKFKFGTFLIYLPCFNTICAVAMYTAIRPKPFGFNTHLQ